MDDLRVALARRINEIRVLRYGDDLAAVSTECEVPERTWLNYESGVTIPGHILLRFIDATGTSPRWLLRGEGSKCSDDCATAARGQGAIGARTTR